MRATPGNAPKKTAARPVKPAQASEKGATPIASGLTDPDKVFSAPGLAEELALVADGLSKAMESGHFCEAIEHNLEVWVAIKTLVARQNGQVDAETRSSLMQVADQVAAATFAMAQVFTPDSVLPLITIDLEVSKALVGGVLNQMIRDRAYFLWQEAGSPHGTDQQFWYTAEQEIRGVVAD